MFNALANKRIDAFDTISIISHQLHDDQVNSHIDKALILADGVHVASSYPSRIEGKHISPIATQWVCNPIHALSLRNCITHASSGIVYLKKADKYILETSWGWAKYRTLATQVFDSKSLLRVNSTNPVYVYSGTGYHGVVEDLAAILLLLSMGIHIDIAINPLDIWMNGLLDLFVPACIRRIDVSHNSWIEAPIIIATTKSAFGEFVHPQLINQLKAVAQKIEVPLPAKSFFISRVDSTKRLSNRENMLSDHYGGLGYENLILGNLDVKEQILLFRSAHRVAGMHGAGFVNLAWSNPGVIVDEYYMPSHFNSCYSAICHYGGHTYKCHDVNQLGP